MIKHVVCFKLFNQDPTHFNEVKEKLMSMKGNVPQIRDIEVGKDFLHSARSYDIILTVTLDDEKALDDYQNDEYHRTNVKPYMHHVAVNSISIDYYID